mgnify:CR=1 FL=1
MKSFALALFGAAASARLMDVKSEYVQYLAKFNKEYKSEEEFEGRYLLFQKHDEALRMLKIQHKSSKHGHNHLSDWTEEEKTKLLGLKNMPLPKKSETLF